MRRDEKQMTKQTPTPNMNNRRAKKEDLQQRNRLEKVSRKLLEGGGGEGLKPVLSYDVTFKDCYLLKWSYDKQNLTLVVISYEIYETR